MASASTCQEKRMPHISDRGMYSKNHDLNLKEPFAALSTNRSQFTWGNEALQIK